MSAPVVCRMKTSSWPPCSKAGGSRRCQREVRLQRSGPQTSRCSSRRCQRRRRRRLRRPRRHRTRAEAAGAPQGRRHRRRWRPCRRRWGTRARRSGRGGRPCPSRPGSTATAQPDTRAHVPTYAPRRSRRHPAAPRMASRATPATDSRSTSTSRSPPRERKSAPGWRHQPVRGAGLARRRREARKCWCCRCYFDSARFRAATPRRSPRPVRQEARCGTSRSCRRSRS
mmetsp:Transcript_123899/g.396010  ORF Transcript_123899/g.396010 Transcript_123899/m.396010 type:complete len:227 (+) Transcript_123899:27-707(+)